jgi:hypothetical protein
MGNTETAPGGAIDPAAASGSVAASEGISELAARAGIPLSPESDRVPHVFFSPDLRVVAHELGSVIPRLDLFLRGGELVYYSDAEQAMLPMDPATFRTWINGHVLIWARSNKALIAEWGGVLGPEDRFKRRTFPA